jgi:sigma-B regulation protein RsbU (phosphoserine phosphatase)
VPEPRTSNILPLRLIPVAGPEIEPLEIPAETPGVLGRSMECQHCLPDPSVSRRHVEIARRAGRWLVTDLASRGGSFLNSLKLNEHTPTPMAAGDELRIYPWTFRVQIGSADASGPMTMSLRTTDDSTGQGRYVETFTGAELQGLAQQRLTLLLDYATELNAATTEEELASLIVRSALSGSGLGRAALLRTRGDVSEVEILANQSAEGLSATGAFSFSRTLIREAEAGNVARIGGQQANDPLHSIVAMGIHSAICAPLVVDGSVVACLYLDARGAESRVRPDALDFCIALARLAGLAFANIQRAKMRDRQRELEDELGAARQAQQWLVPLSGRIGGVAYQVHMQPGEYVAGDLFDVVQLNDGRVAVCIGDVTGHGAGAGIVMAAAQAFLHAALRAEQDPARAVAAVNRYISQQSRMERFASLWVGVFDPDARTVTAVDAGHGYCVAVDAARHATLIRCSGGHMLGVDADCEYEATTIPLPADGRLVIFSDGVVEQSNRAGDMYGVPRLCEALKNPTSDDPRTIVEAVERFAEGLTLNDDATAAVIRWV